MIQCTDVIFGYKDGARFQANLRIPSQQLTMIVGANGSGKSTLLKMLAGVISPESGDIQVDNAYMVFAQDNLFPGLNIRDNLTLVEGCTRAFADDLLKTYGIEDLASSFPHELSSGQCQLVALLRVFCVPQKIILLDEPLNYLHEDIAQRLMCDLANHIRVNSKTLVVVSHQQKIVEKHTDTCLSIDKIVRCLR